MPPRGGSRDAVSVVNVFAHRGEFFRVLQETERSQTAVMTVAPAVDAGQPEVHDADPIVYVVECEANSRLGDVELNGEPGASAQYPSCTRHPVRHSITSPTICLE